MPRRVEVWLVSAIAVFVAPYLFVIIYPLLSGTSASQALDAFRSSVGELYVLLYLVVMIGCYIAWYSAHKKRSLLVP